MPTSRVLRKKRRLARQARAERRIIVRLSFRLNLLQRELNMRGKRMNERISLTIRRSHSWINSEVSSVLSDVESPSNYWRQDTISISV
jgi:hypothetical protein